jgi:hypothetical protein
MVLSPFPFLSLRLHHKAIYKPFANNQHCLTLARFIFSGEVPACQLCGQGCQLSWQWIALAD